MSDQRCDDESEPGCLYCGDDEAHAPDCPLYGPEQEFPFPVELEDDASA